MFLTIACMASFASADDDSHIGKQGNTNAVSRAVKLTQVDNMFLPNEIWVTQGETIRFVVKNAG